MELAEIQLLYCEIPSCGRVQPQFTAYLSEALMISCSCVFPFRVEYYYCDPTVAVRKQSEIRHGIEAPCGAAHTPSFLLSASFLASCCFVYLQLFTCRSIGLLSVSAKADEFAPNSPSAPEIRFSGNSFCAQSVWNALIFWRRNFTGMPLSDRQCSSPVAWNCSCGSRRILIALKIKVGFPAAAPHCKFLPADSFEQSLQMKQPVIVELCTCSYIIVLSISIIRKMPATADTQQSFWPTLKDFNVPIMLLFTTSTSGFIRN